MTQDGGDQSPETVDVLRQQIAQQAAEIDRLKRRIADDSMLDELREAVRLSLVAEAISAPVSHGRLLDMIVATAADIIGANAAALFMIDREQEDLVFEVALGEKADEVKKFRVPLGHGVAGLVALTGQPMAVSDTEKDDRDAADIAEAVGYVPKNILCVPLFYSDQVIGVLELLDKEGAAHFSPEDMEALGLFANQAAVAIEHTTLIEKSHEMQEALAVRKLMERAKGYLMRSKKLTEEEAFKLIQRQSMDFRKSMREIAEAVLLAGELDQRAEKQRG